MVYQECKNHRNLLARLKKRYRYKINKMQNEIADLQSQLDNHGLQRQKIINQKNEEFMMEWMRLASERNK